MKGSKGGLGPTWVHPCVEQPSTSGIRPRNSQVYPRSSSVDSVSSQIRTCSEHSKWPRLSPPIVRYPSNPVLQLGVEKVGKSLVSYSSIFVVDHELKPIPSEQVGTPTEGGR